MIPFRESDGIGAALQRVECAWCGAFIKAQVCVPSMADEVSHGMCLPCADDYLEGRPAKRCSSVLRGGLEGGVNCGLNPPADAAPRALLSAGQPAVTDEAASGPSTSCPEPTVIRVNGIPAPAADRSAEAALEPHPSRDPVASSTLSPAPVFWLITGYDFARSLRWARRQRNSVSDQIRARRSQQ